MLCRWCVSTSLAGVVFLRNDGTIPPYLFSTTNCQFVNNQLIGVSDRLALLQHSFDVIKESIPLVLLT